MEDGIFKNTLKMKYARSKTMDISGNYDSRENSRHKFKGSTEELSEAAGRSVFKKGDSTGLQNFQPIDSTSTSCQKLSEQVENLKLKLEQEKSKNSEFQKQIFYLTRNLQDAQKTAEHYKDQQAELSKNLNKKTKDIEKLNSELLSARKSAEEKDAQLLHLKDAALKEQDQLQRTLHQNQEELNKILAALEKKQEENDECKKKVVNFTQALENESRMVKDLEQSLSEETTKTKKLQRVLEFVIQNANDEKAELNQRFEEFKEASIEFLKSCDSHNVAVLKAVEEEEVQK